MLFGMERTFRDVLDDIGVDEALATALGVKLERIRKWRHRQRIPSEYWLPLATYAAGKGQRLSFAELAAIAATQPRAQRTEAAA